MAGGGTMMLGIDIGGTKVSVGRVGRDGRVLGETLTRPSKARDSAEVVDIICAAVHKELAQGGADVAGVGLGCAGTIDHAGGVVVTSPNLPLKNAPLRERLQERLGLPVTIENDANAAAVAEHRVGAAVGMQHVVLITLGTGIGGALILDGKLYRGAHGAAGEIGHTVVEADGETCKCGRRGCWEQYASGTGLARVVFRTVGLFERGAFSGEAVGALARENFAAAHVALAEVADWLGLGIVNIVNIFDPEMVVVGGGLGNLGELLLGPAREMLKEALPPGRDQTRVVSAALGADAGLIGAALLAWDEFGVKGKREVAE
jgi:glucokinase